MTDQEINVIRVLRDEGRAYSEREIETILSKWGYYRIGGAQSLSASSNRYRISRLYGERGTRFIFSSQCDTITELLSREGINVVQSPSHYAYVAVDVVDYNV